MKTKKDEGKKRACGVCGSGRKRLTKTDCPKAGRRVRRNRGL